MLPYAWQQLRHQYTQDWPDKDDTHLTLPAWRRETIDMEQTPTTLSYLCEW